MLSVALFFTLALAFFTVIAPVIIPGSASAAEKKTLMFRGVKVKPISGIYIVLKDVRIRAKPKTKSKKLGSG